MSDQKSIDRIYERCEITWGAESQETVAAEECCELAAAICRLHVGKGTAEQVIDELADVLIMVEQLRRLFGEGKCDAAKHRKLAKLVQRLDDIDAKYGTGGGK